jgi:hypothetical protein
MLRFHKYKNKYSKAKKKNIFFGNFLSSRVWILAKGSKSSLPKNRDFQICGKNFEKITENKHIRNSTAITKVKFFQQFFHSKLDLKKHLDS